MNDDRHEKGTQMTTQWVMEKREIESPAEIELLQETAVAMAQATIQNAINERKISKSELAKRMGRQRSLVTRMMRGDYNITIKTYALALAACGYHAKFGYAPVTWRWSAAPTPKPQMTNKHYVPTGVGTSMHTLAA